MPQKIYNALRRVYRLEYLYYLLKSIQDGYRPENVLDQIQDSQSLLEINKSKVLGNKNPRAVNGEATLRETEKMAVQMQFASRQRNGYSLSIDGELLLQEFSDGWKTPLSDEARRILLSHFWLAYPKFGNVITAITSQQDGKMDLPLPSDANFAEEIFRLYKYEIDPITFKIVREIAAELDILNWYILENDNERLQRVYAVACIASLEEIKKEPLYKDQILNFYQRGLVKIRSEINALGNNHDSVQNEISFENAIRQAKQLGILVIEGQQGPMFSFNVNNPTKEDFENQVWKTYLEMVGFRSLIPVLYPEIRNYVAFELRISDKRFDLEIIDLINSPRRIKVYPSIGILDYSRHLGYLHKYMPPMTSDGKFISFLKIKRLE